MTAASAITNLKQRLEGFDAQVISAGDRFKENAFGSAQVGNGVGTFFEQVGATGHSKNPLANAQLMGPAFLEASHVHCLQRCRDTPADLRFGQPHV